MARRFVWLAAGASLAVAAASGVGCGKRWPTIEPAANAEPAAVAASNRAPLLPLSSADYEVALPQPSVHAFDAAASCPLPATRATPSAQRDRGACDPARPAERIRVYQLSDVHGRWTADDSGHSPLAVVRAFVDEKRRENAGKVLFFDGGDDLEKGTIAELRSNGEATLQMVERLGLDARTLGNHDFAYGTDSVLRQAASNAHDVLASNIRWQPTSESATPGATFGAKRWVVYQVGCARIGVFGLVINPYDETDDRVDAAYLGAFVQEHDEGDADRYVETAAAIVRELREVEHVDAVIAVNHLGIARDRALIDQVPGLDLVLSGHDHVHVPGRIAGRHGSLISPGSFMRNETGASDPRLGEAVLEVDPRAHSARVTSGGALRIADLGPADDELDQTARTLVGCYAPDADTPIATLAAPVRAQLEATWTPLFDAAIARAFPQASAMLYEAWLYGGIVKGDLPRGPVTPQALADFAFVEKQRAGGPGFTAFEAVSIGGEQLRAICEAPLRETASARMHRVCPKPASIDLGARYQLVIERRPLHAPLLAFTTLPAGFPSPSDTVGAPIEAWELLEALARAATAEGKLLDAMSPIDPR
jgi:hypothetical protein